MIRPIIHFLFLLVFWGLDVRPAPLAAQTTLRYEDQIYANHLYSITFTIEGFFITMPILRLGSDARIELEFDDFRTESQYYYYRVIQCDVDWKPTPLTEMEYIDGYAQDQLREFQYSFRTQTNYTHYRLTLPNESTRFTKSGNYLLVVYEDSRAEKILLSRRFVVADPRVEVDAVLNRPVDPEKFQSHHEWDFAINTEKLNARNPLSEIRATVLQNGRWDNAISGLPPNFIRSNLVQFDYQDKVVFPAGREFRYLDLRSLYLPAKKVTRLEKSGAGIEVYLEADKSRQFEQYFQISDLNGHFIIENQDQGYANPYQSQGRRRRNSNAQLPLTVDTNQLTEIQSNIGLYRLRKDARDPFNHDLSAEYAFVHFALYANQPLDEDVYWVGKITDWQRKPAYKMTYNPATSCYEGRFFLKQGFYEYAYALGTGPSPNPALDLGEFEGNWWETENTYTILIYYRPFGSRYDQVIGWREFSSNRF